jgi:hypothetical protein
LWTYPLLELNFSGVDLIAFDHGFPIQAMRSTSESHPGQLSILANFQKSVRLHYFQKPAVALGLTQHQRQAIIRPRRRCKRCSRAESASRSSSLPELHHEILHSEEILRLSELRRHR